MMTTVSSKGQIVLPAELRAQDGIEPGQRFEVERVEAGEYRLRRIDAPKNQGLVRLLLDCPVKGWFEPADRTETTDHIPVTRLG
jgi:AbrB family looped-hinge helix DNA binding protein